VYAICPYPLPYYSRLPPHSVRRVRRRPCSFKFYRSNASCPHKIFCERLPNLVAEYGRRSHRVRASLWRIGLALAVCRRDACRPYLSRALSLDKACSLRQTASESSRRTPCPHAGRAHESDHAAAPWDYYYNDAYVKLPFSAAHLDRWRGYAGLRRPLLLPLGCQQLAQKRLFIAIGRIRRVILPLSPEPLLNAQSTIMLSVRQFSCQLRRITR